MVRTGAVSIGEKFEPAIALKRAIHLVAWQRRIWTAIAVLSLLVASVTITVLAFIALSAIADRIAPAMLIWLFWLILSLGATAVIAVGVMGVRWLALDRFSKVVICVDQKLGGDAIRNALDLAKLREDEKFVSTQFARVAIYRAWKLWQDASQNGLANELIAHHKQRAQATLAIALPILLLTLLIAHAIGFSFTSLTEIYRNAKAVLAFERDGQLRLVVEDEDKVVLKGTVVPVRVRASCRGLQLPENLTVWLLWKTGDRSEQVQMQRLDNDEFSAELTVTESGTLQAFSGKVKSNLVHLQAVNPPQVAEWLITVEPPTYTNLPPETFVTSQWQHLTVLKGSKVTISATVTENLRDAECEFSEVKSQTPNALSLSDERTVQWSATVLTSVRMKWRFVDRFGFVGETSWLSINVQTDKPPKVAVIAGLNPAMAGGFVPLTIRAEDDFGISELTMQFGLGDEKKQPSEIRSVPLSFAPSLQVEQTLALPIPVDAAGKVLWVRAIAKDNDAVSGAKVSSSQWLLVRIREPEELVGTLQDWLGRLKAWESWLQKGEWAKTQQELAKWLQRWQEILQQAQWSETPITHQWLAEWLSHWQEHLQRKDLEGALQELWQMQRAIERALAEQKLAELAQEISALRAQQEAIYDALRRHARPSSLASAQKQLTERTKEFINELNKEAERWESLDEPTVAFALQDAARILERRPTERAMLQARDAMEQDLREMALLRTHEALTDLREAEETLSSPTQNPLAQLYRRERNLLAQLLEQTERLRRDQSSLRQETEKSLPTFRSDTAQSTLPSFQLPNIIAPPPPPSWSEVEKLSTGQNLTQQPVRQQSLVERQGQLKQRAEQMQRPLREAMKAVPQLSPEALHSLQDAVNQMSEAAKLLQQLSSYPTAARHQRHAETALQRLAEILREALMVEHGTATQRVGAGENEAMALAQRQAQLLQETQRLHQQQRQGRTPSPMRLRQLGAEEGSIRDALSRIEGFFGDALMPELRQRVQQSSQHLRWLERNLPEGKLGNDAQQRQREVLETLLELARILSGQQGSQKGQQQVRQGQTPSQPDINWGRFVEHGPPMRQVPEALQGAKGGASFVEPSSKSTNAPMPLQMTVPRTPILPAYREAIQNYHRQIR